MPELANTENQRRRFDWPKWVALYTAASFLVFGVDSAINHIAGGVIHEKPLAYTPLIFAPLAVVAMLVAFSVERWRAAIAWVVGVLAVIVGATGMVFHVLGDLEDVTQVSVAKLLKAFGPDSMPPFAPAAFAATGILVLLIGLDAWLRRRGSNENE